MNASPISEQQKKITALVQKLAQSPTGTEMLRAALGDAGLSLLKICSIGAFPAVTDPERIAKAQTGIILDVESTGLDTSKDEITELAMLKFTYDEQGIIALDDLYDEFNEPSKPIPDEVIALTGITNEMVKGHKIDIDEVKAFKAGAKIVLAHNAAYDRKIVEKQLPEAGFDQLDWHCTVNQIDWLARGKNGRSLEVLTLSEGYVYGSHRADADIIATAFVLLSENSDGVSAFGEMLQHGNTPSILLVAKDTPFNIPMRSSFYDAANPKTPCGDFLKARNYRWSPDGADFFKAADKGWHTEIFGDDKTVQEEADFLRNLYARDVSIPSFRVTAADRYSDRRPGEVELFRTAEVQDLKEAAFQAELDRQPALDL